MIQKITQTDLAEAGALQREALRAIENGNYDAAFQLAGAIDQVFYRKGIDLVVAADWMDNDISKLCEWHNGSRITSWGARQKPYAWEIDRIKKVE